MAIEVAIETTISRTPEVVFERISDVASWPRWLIATGIVSVDRVVTGPLRAGERLTVEQRAAGRAGTFDAVVRQVQPPARLVLDGRDADGVSIEIDARLDRADDGTALRWSIRIGLPFRYRFLESMARPQVQRAAALDVEALRRDLESVARPDVG